MDDLKQFGELYVGDTFYVAESNIRIKKISYRCTRNAVIEDDGTIVDVPEGMMVLPILHRRMTTSEQAKWIIKDSGISKSDIARIIGVTPQHIHYHKSNLSMEQMEMVLNDLGYDLIIRRKKK